MQVEQPLDEPGDAVLRPAEPPGAVVDDDLADAEAAGVGQHRDEPVQLAVDADLVEDLAAIGLEAAVVVVQPGSRSGELTIRLKTRLGPTLCQGSCRVCFQPLTTSNPSSSLSRKRGISAGSSWRSPSRVKTIEPRGGLEAGGQGGGLAEVAAEPDAA